jgi:hypothetical protein
MHIEQAVVKNVGSEKVTVQKPLRARMGTADSRPHPLLTDLKTLNGVVEQIASIPRIHEGLRIRFDALPYLSEIANKVATVKNDLVPSDTSAVLRTIQSKVFGLSEDTAPLDAADTIYEITDTGSPFKSAHSLLRSIYLDLARYDVTGGASTTETKSAGAGAGAASPSPKKSRRSVSDKTRMLDNLLNTLEVISVAKQSAAEGKVPAFIVYTIRRQDTSVAFCALPLDEQRAPFAPSWTTKVWSDTGEDVVSFALWCMTTSVVDGVAKAVFALQAEGSDKANDCYAYFPVGGSPPRELTETAGAKLNGRIFCKTIALETGNGIFTNVHGPFYGIRELDVMAVWIRSAWPTGFHALPATLMYGSHFFEQNGDLHVPDTLSTLLRQETDAALRTTKFSEFSATLQETKDCSQHAFMQRSKTCWAATVLNLVFLTPKLVAEVRKAALQTPSPVFADARVTNLLKVVINAYKCTQEADEHMLMCSKPFPEVLCKELDMSLMHGWYPDRVLALLLFALGFQVYSNAWLEKKVSFAQATDAGAKGLFMFHFTLPLSKWNRDVLLEHYKSVLCGTYRIFKKPGKGDDHVVACIVCKDHDYYVVIDSNIGAFKVDWYDAMCNNNMAEGIAWEVPKVWKPAYTKHIGGQEMVLVLDSADVYGQLRNQ